MNLATLDTTALTDAGIAVLLPGTDGYDEARSVWNGQIDRRPAMIVQPRDTAGVAAAVKYATANGLLIAVKGGGHSAPGHAICDDSGLVIDLVNLSAARVDPEKKEAWLQGGALLGNLDAATAPHGLVVPAGAISHTGAGGLILGGGFGHIMRKFGLTIDSLLSAEVVLADGTVVTASETSNPDLFWALRGGSGNFGIVTEFHFRAHDFGPDAFVSANIFELADAPAALKIWRETMADAPDELAWLAFFRGAPELPGFEWIPERLVGKPILLMPLIWAGDPEEGRAYIAELTAKLENVAAKVEGTLPYVLVQQQWDEVFAHGMRHYAKAGFLADLPDEALDAIIEATARMPHPRCQVEILRLGGAVQRVPAESTAFPFRDSAWPINILGFNSDPADDAAVRDWVRGIYDAVEPYMSGGTYVNYAGGDETGGNAAPYGETGRRLAGLKAKFDPENRFRFNANITPAR